MHAVSTVPFRLKSPTFVLKEPVDTVLNSVAKLRNQDRIERRELPSLLEHLFLIRLLTTNPLSMAYA